MDEQNNTNTNDMQEMIQQLNDLRNSTVPREEYDKVCKDRKELWKNLVEGTGSSNAQTEAKPLRSSDEVAIEICNGKYDNRKFVKLLDEYQQAVLKETNGQINPIKFRGMDSDPLTYQEERDIDAFCQVLEEMKQFDDAPNDRWYSEWRLRMPS